MLLAVCLVIGLLPTTAFAAGTDTDTGKAIILGTSGIKGPTEITNSNGAHYTPNSYIYFGMNGQDPIKWRVLDADKANNSSTSGMFLLSEHLIGKGPYGDVYFQQSYHKFEGSNTYHKGEEPSDGDHTDCQNAIDWQNSDAQTWCKNFAATNFSTAEQSAMLGTKKEDNAEKSLYNIQWDESRLTTEDKMFFLSARELADYVGNYNGAPGLAATFVDGNAYVWWLRSPKPDTNFVGVVFSGPNIVVDSKEVHGTSAARPAFNLNLDSILFTSAATGGRSSGTRGTLSAVSDYTDKEWKLTLLDSSRSFTANVNGQTSASASAGGSVQITYSGAQTGDNEYVSALLCDSNDTVLYYGNIAQNSASGTVALNIPSGLAAGNYTLNVFSEQCNGDKMTDYASAFQKISLNVTLPQETTPQATFAATGDNGGTLSNVGPGMKYSTDGGKSWNDITATTIELTGVTAENDVKVYKPGNGTTTSDSAVQTIDITQADKPTVSSVDCTTTEQNNGKITSVNNTMEYKPSAASEWMGITGIEVTGLSNGTYDVRVKATGTVLASEAVKVTIDEHICAAQGEWQHDESGHWKLCSCGVEVDREDHSGGEATCTAPAICEVCEKPYGEKNADNHTDTVVWVQTETIHKQVHSCCNAEVSTEEKHNWENGKCTVCDYSCSHTGGTATCSQLAVCSICGEEYGEVNAASHTNLVKTEAKPATHMAEGNKEYWYCGGCDKYFSDGSGTKEIALEDTVLPKLTEHTADGTGWHSDETSHWNTCECGARLKEGSHTFEWVVDKEATKTEPGSRHQECTVCGYAKPEQSIPAIGKTNKPSKSDNTAAASESGNTADGAGKSEKDAVPQTGDNSRIALWIFLLLTAAAVMTGILIGSRRKTYSK